MAEIVCKEIVKNKNISHCFYIDSAGTGGWHVGEGPDHRTESVCKKHYKGVEITHRARQLQDEDFLEFDYILVMDDNNLSTVKDLKPPKCKSNIQLLGSFDPQASAKSAIIKSEKEKKEYVQESSKM